MKKNLGRVSAGFTLVDALFASSILGASVLLSVIHNTNDARRIALLDASAQMVKVATNVERRLLLDGMNSDWQSDLFGYELIENELRSQLNSEQFEGCGDWIPKLEDPQHGMSLLRCDFAFDVPDDYLLAMQVSSVDGRMTSWQLELSTPKPAVQKQMFEAFPELQKAVVRQRHKGFHSQIQATLVKSDSYGSSSDVICDADALDDGCAYRVWLELMPTIDSSLDYELRRDGRNGMLGPLYLSDSLDCTDLEGVDARCGFDFDGKELAISVNNIHTSSALLSDAVNCFGADGGQVPCGARTVDGLVTLSVNSINITDQLYVFDESDTLRLSVDSVGVSFPDQYLELDGSLVAEEVIADSLASKQALSAIDLIGFGSVGSSDGLYYGQNTIQLPLAISGSGCTPNPSADELRLSTEGELLVCRSGAWQGLSLGGEVSAGLGVFYADAECPDGYSKLEALTEGPVSFVRRGFQYTDRNEDGQATSSAKTASNASWGSVYGNNQYKFRLSELPAHRHTRSTHQIRFFRKPSSTSWNALYGMEDNDGTSNSRTEGKSYSFDIEPPNIPLTMCITN